LGFLVFFLFCPQTQPTKTRREPHFLYTIYIHHSRTRRCARNYTHTERDREIERSTTTTNEKRKE